MRGSIAISGVIVAAVLVGMTTASAGPTIIRDIRVQDKSATPALGRGYSISTNTFQSSCMKDVTITDPSYDFEYTFEDGETAMKHAAGGSYRQRVAYSSRWWGMQSEDRAVTAATAETGQTHDIVVDLNIDTYYASVDEANSKFSDAAAGLLQGQDVPGFFSACGPYYTRSIRRNAKLQGVLSYWSKTTARDYKYESQLRLQLNSSYRNRTGGGAESRDQEFRYAAADQAAEKRLTIQTRGWGIGKDDKAALVATDVESFKGAIKQAFIAMQNPLTGRVVSIEVVPWVENAEFQNLVSLRGDDFVEDREVPLYEKKDILTYNSEFITELQRQGRHLLNMHYKARLCAAYIRTNWVDFETKAVKQEIAALELVNHRGALPSQPFTVADLWAALRADAGDQSVESQYNGFYMDYMYRGMPSAMGCMTKLFAEEEQEAAGVGLPAGGGAEVGGPGAVRRIPGFGRGLFLRRYFVHKDCTEMEKKFGGIELPQQIEDYCMPQLK